MALTCEFCFPEAIVINILMSLLKIECFKRWIVRRDYRIIKGGRDETEKIRFCHNCYSIFREWIFEFEQNDKPIEAPN